MGSIFSRSGGTGRVTTYNFGGNGGRATYDGRDDLYNIPGGNIQDNLRMFSDLQANSDALAGAINQAQDLDATRTFQDNVDFAVNNPAELTKEDYDKFSSEIGDIQRALLNPEQKKAAISQVLSKAGIYHDVASLDILGKGSDAGGLLSKRIKIVPPKDSGGGGDQTADPADTVSAAANSSSADDDLNNVLDAAGIGGANDIVDDSQTSETYSWIYDAATDSFQEGYFQDQTDGTTIRIATGESIPKGQVFGAEDKVFADGETAVIMARGPNESDGVFLEHGGKDKFEGEDQQDSAFQKVLDAFLSGNMTWTVLNSEAKDIYGDGSIGANKAIIKAAEKLKEKNDANNKAAAEGLAKQQAALAKEAAQGLSDGNTDMGLLGNQAAADGQLGSNTTNTNTNNTNTNNINNTNTNTTNTADPNENDLDTKDATCGEGTKLAGQLVPADGNCNPTNDPLDLGIDPNTGIGGGVGVGTGIGVGPGVGSGTGGGEGNSNLSLFQSIQQAPMSLSLLDKSGLNYEPTPLLSRILKI